MTLRTKEIHTCPECKNTCAFLYTSYTAHGEAQCTNCNHLVHISECDGDTFETTIQKYYTKEPNNNKGEL